MKILATIGTALLCLIVFYFVYTVASSGIQYEAEVKQAFFSDCIKHEPAYQCEVKWKQMHPDPIIVYAPFNK